MFTYGTNAVGTIDKALPYCGLALHPWRKDEPALCGDRSLDGLLDQVHGPYWKLQTLTGEANTLSDAGSQSCPALSW
jgi:hypothetical protein